MHFQTTVPNWKNALLKMPDHVLLKAVNDAAILIDGLNSWVSAGRDPAKLFLDHRYVDFIYPDWDAASTWTHEEFKDFWRANFPKTIDATYYNNFAPHIRYIEELNEYTDTRMITDAALLAPRIASARAAVDVWNSEYRGKNGIPSDARLVVCNSPVGNDIPIEFFQLCRDEDAVLGVRAYTHWTNKTRDPEDFRYHSGRPFFNEQAYGIKVDILIGESGPYDGTTWNGWRAQSCMGGDGNLLVQGMRQWWLDLSGTAAYAEGRIIGPGAWFTCNQGDWDLYRLYEAELVPLAEACAAIWSPGSGPGPDPDPDPQPDPECYGLPRTQYHRTFNAVPSNATEEQAVAIFLEGWRRGKETTGGSYDDAGIGDLANKTANLYGIAQNDQQTFRDWFTINYPGTHVVFMTMPANGQAQIEIVDIVDELPKHETLRYASRPLTDITTLTIHHTVSPDDRSIESIAQYHVDGRGWPGIGYHFVIKADGRIYQTNYLDTISYHSAWNNDYSVGIALQGDFTNAPPPQAQLDAARALVAELKVQLDIETVLPHRLMPDSATACPGNTWEQWFDYVAGEYGGVR